MATRVAELKIQLAGAKSLNDLEQSLEDINEELKELDTNSDAFKELAAVAREADVQVSELDDSLKGVTSAQKADGMLKLGEGIAGAAVGAQGLALAFGENNEELEKVIGRIGGMIAALDGAKKVTEALSAENRKFIGAAIDGWKKSAIGAKLFGTTSRAALTASGIGLLVVALGLVIANWDTIIDKVVEWKDVMLEALKFISPPLYFIIDGVQTLIEKFGSFEAVIGGVIEAMKALFSFDFDGIGEAFTKGAEAAQKIVEAEEALKKLLEETNVETERTIQLLEAQGDKEDEIYKLKKKALEEEIKARETINDEDKEQIKLLKDAEQQLKLLNIQEGKRLEAIEDNAEAQRIADKEKADAAKQQQLDIKIANQLIQQQINLIDGTAVGLSNVNSVMEEQIDWLRTMLEGWRAGVVSAEDFEKKIQSINEGFGDLISVEEIKNSISELEKSSLALLARNTELAKILLTRKRTSEEELELEQNKIALEENKIKFSQQSLKLKQLEVDLILTEIDETRKAAAEQKALDDQAIADALERQELFLFQNSTLQDGKNIVGDLWRDMKKFKDEIRESGSDAEKLMLFIQETSTALNLIGEAFAIGFEASLVALDNQILKLNDDLDEIGKKQDDFNEREAKFQDERVDYNELLKDANADRFKDLFALQEEQRRQEEALAAEKEALHRADIDKQNEIIAAENEQAEIQKKQAIGDAIIQTLLAVIQALPNVPLSIAVGLLGAASTATIAAQKVPKQKLLDYKDGGYTAMHSSDSVPAGITHTNEYIVPSPVLKSEEGAALVNTLESMRTGFQDGGFTSDAPNLESVATTSVRDVDRRPIVVSVVEITEKQNSVKVLKSKSSIGGN